MQAKLNKTIQIELTMEEARKIRQDLGDLDPARMNTETMSLRDRLHLLTHEEKERS